MFMSEKQYRRRLCDRSDGRLLKKLSPMHRIEPYIMVHRNDSTNLIFDKVEVTKLEEYIRLKRKQGYKGFGMLHVMMAAYVRVVSQRPAVNRFISGQKIYARNNIEINIDIKKEMTLESPNTVVKIEFDAHDTAADVYDKMKEAIADNKGGELDSDFDNTARILNYIPGLIKKFSFWLIRVADYFGILPKSLLKVSPFHGSMFVTSMGSLGIPAIHHHLYNLGNVPVFCCIGPKRTEYEMGSDGTVSKRKYVDYTFSVDERICDGFYFASAMKILKMNLRHPEKLDVPPEEVETEI